MARPISRTVVRQAFLDSFKAGPFGARALLHLVLALAIMELLIWCHSGTLSPYSAVDHPRDLLGCGYTGNTDHGEFVGVYWMLKGLPVELWQNSVYLRRLVYPLLAFPLSVLTGFTMGGFFTNLLLHAAALACWCWFLFKTLGRRAAVWGVWLLATWPGIFYWAGLPYAHAAIVPFSVLAFALLHELYDRPPIRKVFLVSFGIGIAWQAYDSLMLFGVAGLIVLIWKDRRPLALAAGVAGLALPAGLTVLALTHLFHVPTLANSNTNIYVTIATAYWNAVTGQIDADSWYRAVGPFFSVLADNYFDSGFAVLPALLLVLLAVNRACKLTPADPASVAVALVFVGVFLFNNLAPPYSGWSMRGVWIARLYQPAFVAVPFFAARMIWASLTRTGAVRALVTAPIALAVLGNLAIAAGGITANWTVTAEVYHRFYRHADELAYQRHLDTYGRRPFGFCRKDVNWPDLVRVKE